MDTNIEMRILRYVNTAETALKKAIRAKKKLNKILTFKNFSKSYLPDISEDKEGNLVLLFNDTTLYIEDAIHLMLIRGYISRHDFEDKLQKSITTRVSKILRKQLIKK